ncbi:hypothetical protein HC175_17340, partial [Salinimicrobium sp. CDJ15-91]|nr:hypothetical protein [Salinimicrobium oceani]
TYELLRSMIEIADEDSELIRKLRKQELQNFQAKESYAFDFVVDSSQTSNLNFKGYEADRIKSEVTGFERLKYDTTRPYTREVTYYDSFKPSRQLQVPQGYIIPQGWWEVLDLLELNEVKMVPFDKDTSMVVETYRIKDYKTSSRPYEGHYPHTNVEVETFNQEVKIRKGDVF